MPRTLVLVGGGIDSTALLIWLKVGGHDCSAMFFKYGQIAKEQEQRSIKYFCGKYSVPLIEFSVPIHQIATSAILGNGELNKLEGRNVIFVMLAATYAASSGHEAIALGYHQEPENAPFPDATVRALSAMQGTINAAYHTPIKLWAPFAGKTRTDIARLGDSLDPDDFFAHTHTCYRAVTGGCGECAHCQQREVIINNLTRGRDDALPANA